ncbi:hypothetical protein N5853_09250 [Bartonella sp. HY329]|uniref:hypothetical protein n=1 Tax=unclassified Bartonella TaxID=2645622 RepID=UPI0021C84311|nr:MULTISPECIES: hypothetical protein [unclassified Bartonella]UXM94292.1 hypothetical protein N5853_09250 [Bartonella sp. HY329]UXN08615.1 hypothetical protein N5852_09260 [Bartonella sp. HY328]
MNKAIIYKDEVEVLNGLKDFGVTVDEFREVIRNTLAERLSCFDGVDPNNAKGQISYIMGTRYLRFLFLKKGWRLSDYKNIPSIEHPESRTRIIYQTVDIAASLAKDPKPISSKGNGSAALIDDAQGSLFPFWDDGVNIPKVNSKKLNKSIWYLCVSYHGDGLVRAELSLPRSIENGTFGKFIFRIFLMQNEDLSINTPEVTVDPFEIEPTILRKVENV